MKWPVQSPFMRKSLKGDPMNTVIFKTENSVFQLDLKKVKERLEILATEYAVDEAETILRRISIPSDESKLIQVKQDYFGYVVLELIGAGKGSVICEICGKMYEAQNLKLLTLGAGDSPFSINTGKKRGIKSLFGKRKNPSILGGQGLSCPEDHKLIEMETWRT